MLKQIFGSKVGNVSAADASYQDYLNKNTYCELKQVVGKMQYENWTFEQKQKIT